MIPEMRDGEKAPELLLDISDMTELSYIREDNGSIAIGAATTIAEMAASPVLQDNSPILASAAKQLGNPLTRNRATLGGNLANASPCADTAPPLLALDASVEEIKFRRLQKNQEISEQKSRVFETQRTIDRMENDLAHLHKDIERLTDEIAEIESARQDLEKKDTGITAEIAQVKDQNIEINTRVTHETFVFSASSS